MCISTLDKQFEHFVKNIIHYLFEIFSVCYSTFICALWKCAIFLLKSIGFLNRGSLLARCVDDLDSGFILFYSTDARIYIHPQNTREYREERTMQISITRKREKNLYSDANSLFRRALRNIKLEHVAIVDDEVSSFAQEFIEIFIFFLFYFSTAFISIYFSTFSFIHFRKNGEREEIALGQYDEKEIDEQNLIMMNEKDILEAIVTCVAE